MNSNYLKSEIVKKGYNVSSFSAAIDMPRKNLYRRINGEVQFTLAEISKIKECLKLSTEEFMSIFF